MEPAGDSLFPSKPFAAALGVFRPHAGKLGLVGFSHVGMAGLEPTASRPPAARAANCATFRNRRHPLSEPKPRWAKKEDGGVARRPGLEPGSTVLETAVLAIAPPTQREASMTPRAWPPGPPDGRHRGRLPRAPSRIRTGDLPLTRRLRYHWAIGALTVLPSLFQCMMRVCPHGCLVRRATEEPSGGAGGIRTRDLPVANGMRCLCATAPCRPPPMRGPAGKGVIRVAALRRWCPRPDSNRRRPP